MYNSLTIKILKSTVYLLIMLLLLAVPLKKSFGQGMEDPASWTYELKKKSATEYDVVFHLTLKDGWHIWSLNPGGDGYEIAPNFIFDRGDKLQLKGKVKEQGKPVTQKVAGMPKPIIFFNSKVDFVQTVTIKSGEVKKITGEHQYQVCNESICLPPKTKKFELELKG